MRQILIGLSMIVGLGCADAGTQLSDEAHYNWLHMQGNLQAQEKLLELSKAEATDTLIVNVNLVDVVNGRIREQVAVMIRDGKVEWIRDDELVEVTPKSIRMRKLYLDPNERKRYNQKKV